MKFGRRKREQQQAEDIGAATLQAMDEATLAAYLDAFNAVVDQGGEPGSTATHFAAMKRLDGPTRARVNEAVAAAVQAQRKG